MPRAPSRVGLAKPALLLGAARDLPVVALLVAEDIRGYGLNNRT
jgi:hypothetical protein